MASGNNIDFKLRTCLLWALIAAPFLGGYFYFLNFEIAGITIDVFRLVLGICTVICMVKVIQRKWDVNLGKGSCGLLVLFLIATLVVSVINIEKRGIIAGEMTEMIAVLSVIVYLFCISVLMGDSFELWKKLQTIMMSIGAVVVVLSYAEVLLGFCLVSSRYNSIEYIPGYSVHPATSIYSNENNLAAFFLIICTIIIFSILKENDRRKSLIMFIELMSILVLLTLSDSTIYKMGMIIEIVLAVVLYMKSYGKSMSLFVKSGAIATLIFGILIVYKSFFRKTLILMNIFVNNGWAKMMSVNIDDKISQGDAMIEQLSNTGLGTVTIRKNLFFYGIDAVGDKPLFGYGANSFSTVIRSNEAWVEGTGGVVDPHNLIIELAVQYGVIVLMLFLIVCAFIFVMSIVGIWKGKFNLQETYCEIFLLLVAFAITTVMPSSFIKYTIYYIPLIICAVGLDMLRRKNANEELL